MKGTITYVKIAIFLILPVIFPGCKKAYNPVLRTNPNSYLVVEAVINTGSDSTIINLSKTVAVEAQSVISPVIGATVTVENEQSGVWALPDIGGGRYGAPALNLSSTSKYRLRIKTADGQEYLSNFVAVQQTPSIDSVGYVTKNGGIEVYVNTHDVTNKTRYYRWDYSETWMFHTQYQSYEAVDTVTHMLVYRQPDQSIFTCFGNDISSNIYLFSTSNLSQDIVFQNPLTDVAFTSEKLETKYSILVRQYGLTSDAYQFYTLLKKNTEQLGGIFDPQPSQLSSNIRCISDSSQVVIGFVTATNIQSKRIFITNSVLPPETLTTYPYQCELDSTMDPNIFITPPYVITPISAAGRYYFSSRGCVDCTIRGTTATPPFWR